MNRARAVDVTNTPAKTAIEAMASQAVREMVIVTAYPSLRSLT
jgi:hypothetical protein